MEYFVNYTSINNKITKLYKGLDIPVAGPNNGTFNVLRQGEAVNALYGYEWAGVNSGNGNPMWYKADGSMVQLNIADQNYYALSKSDPNLGVQTTLATTDRKILEQPHQPGLVHLPIHLSTKILVQSLCFGIVVEIECII